MALPAARSEAEQFGGGQKLEVGGLTQAAPCLGPADAANEQGLDLVIDLLRLPVPTVLTVGPDGRLLGVRTGAGG